MHDIIANAPQGVTRTPERASRPLAVAFALLPFLAFADFTETDRQNLSESNSKLGAISSDTRNIYNKVSGLPDRLRSIDQASQISASKLDTIDRTVEGWGHDIHQMVTDIFNANQEYYGEWFPVLSQAREDLHQIYSLLDYASVSRDRSGFYVFSDELENIYSILSRVTEGDGVASRLRVGLFDPRVSVTNRVEVYSPSLSNQLERLIGHSGFNTNYNPNQYIYPGSSAYAVRWSSFQNALTLQFNRSTGTAALPPLSGNFLTDTVILLRYMAYIEQSMSVSGIRSTFVLDGVTNNQQRAYLEDVAFHRANTNLLESIRAQDQDEYSAMDEFRAAVLAWIDEQRQKDEDGDRRADEYLNEAESVEPERGAAPDGEFGSEDVEDYTDRLDTFSSELQDRAFPEYLTITFPELRPWGRSGSDASSDTYTTIKINLTPAKLVFDSLRLVFGCMYWGLSVLVLWWLIRLVLQMHHKIMEWTFTTTSVSS